MKDKLEFFTITSLYWILYAMGGQLHHQPKFIEFFNKLKDYMYELEENKETN